MPYQFQSRIRYSEIDEGQKLTLPGLVNYFQDCSTFQSEDLGVGVAAMLEKEKAWVLASWLIEIDTLPELAQEVIVQTWPYSFRGFYGERNSRILDAGGKTLASAASLWIYMDVKAGRPCRVDQDLIAAYGLEEPLPLGPISRKIPVPEGNLEKEHFPVMRSHLDTNHHVNNGQYILMAEEYLPDGFSVGRIRVEYRKSAKLHDEIVPLVRTRADQCTVSLCGIDRKPYAVLEFTRKQ